MSECYAHEIEETIEEIEAANVMDECFGISKLVGTMTNLMFKKVEVTIENRDKTAFSIFYKLIVQSCNSFLQTTKHHFNKIETPTNDLLSN
ncbi:hypothetical protein [Marivirga harenae]|uniref:hypothetical protein n=1 Tax=Marivirga harenae TaxID=2010992 RepID=UPI0026E09867|nr:hypothetical protein [Marivirga harenae]WKV11678.1 hypothetical protein Q3Y49_15855 [Marivirga harenae]